jgi:hypothetical protein
MNNIAIGVNPWPNANESPPKSARRERKKRFMTIFLNGKQKRVPRPPRIDSLSVEEFLARNADPIWLHENELWELML